MTQHHRAYPDGGKHIKSPFHFAALELGAIEVEELYKDALYRVLCVVPKDLADSQTKEEASKLLLQSNVTKAEAEAYSAEASWIESEESLDPSTPGSAFPSSSLHSQPPGPPPTITTSTPRRISTQYPVTDPSDLEEIRSIILSEFGTELYTCNDAWPKQLYKDLVPEATIDIFLAKGYSGYNVAEQRWTEVPLTPDCEERLYGPLITIIKRIIDDKEFRKLQPNTKGVTRKVINTSNVYFRHDNREHATRPDISIQATGPSFQFPSKDPEDKSTPLQLRLNVGYSNVAAVFDVKVDKGRDSKSNILDDTKQISIYGRQFFIFQPNREFVRSLIITQTSARLYHFDRSGILIAPFVDIHKNPHMFVRLVLGLSWKDEKILGLDTTIQWTHNAEKRKASGIIEALDGQGRRTQYKIDMKKPLFTRASVRGRGTVCWRAIDPVSGARVLIKDSWRTTGRIPEGKFLKDIKGVPGVVQAISFSDKRANTKDYRPEGLKGKEFFARIKSRVVMEDFGLKTLEEFRSRLEVIAAFRDIIAAHKHLVLLKKILHRDISLWNIILRDEDTPDGVRGALADFDMTVSTERAQSEVSEDPRSAARRFQPVVALMAFDPKLGFTPPDDFLNDLESIFLILAYLMMVYQWPGAKMLGQESVFALWEDKRWDIAFSAKATFITTGVAVANAWWGRDCQMLLMNFQKLVAGVLSKKREIFTLHASDPHTIVKKLEQLAKDNEGIYDILLEAFDTALPNIKSLEARLEAKKVAERAKAAASGNPQATQAAPNTPSPPERAPVRRTRSKRNKDAASLEEPVAPKRRRGTKRDD